MSLIDEGIEAGLLITRKADARRKIEVAKTMMVKHPLSFGWVKSYVANTAIEEEAFLALRRIAQRQA